MQPVILGQVDYFDVPSGAGRCAPRRVTGKRRPFSFEKFPRFSMPQAEEQHIDIVAPLRIEPLIRLAGKIFMDLVKEFPGIALFVPPRGAIRAFRE